MKRYEVFVTRPSKGGGAIWARVGSAVENRDASIQVYLDSLPIDGKLFMREPVADPREPKKEEPRKTVHALNNGLAVCGFDPDGPSHWHPNHSWAKVGDSMVDCARCVELTAKSAEPLK